jgi:uncharacterized protein (TIGR03118 family)
MALELTELFNSTWTNQEGKMEKTRFGTVITLLAVVVLAVAGFGISLPAAENNSYTVTNLVSDQPGIASHLDPSLVNAWGLTSTATSPWWVADNGADVSTLYRADGSKVALTIDVRNAPTGAVANTGASFTVTNGTTSGPARFIFSTEEGTILGWNPAVSPTAAVLAVDNSGLGAVYKGLAIASTAGGNFLYATDFRNARVDVFDGNFGPVNTVGAFVDPNIPSGYAPFGIQIVAGRIVVTYAKQDADGEDDVAGQGHGFVDLFDTDGTLIVRVATHGLLNSPWGIALAPSNFGAFSGDLLIGNFGDGRISAFEPQPDGTFELVGQLRTSNHKALAIDGLWALQFGKGATANGPLTTLFFTAGPDDESHGLFGTITTP